MVLSPPLKFTNLRSNSIEAFYPPVLARLLSSPSEQGLRKDIKSLHVSEEVFFSLMFGGLFGSL